MAISLKIDGYYQMQIFNFHNGERLEADIEQGVLDNLQQGEYIIGIQRGEIYDINDLNTPIYKFDLEATDDCELEFESN